MIKQHSNITGTIALIVTSILPTCSHETLLIQEQKVQRPLHTCSKIKVLSMQGSERLPKAKNKNLKTILSGQHRNVKHIFVAL